jgi:hypothetical protein
MKKKLSLFILLVLTFAVTNYERAEALNPAPCLATGDSCIDNGCAQNDGGLCFIATDLCKPGGGCPCFCDF